MLNLGINKLFKNINKGEKKLEKKITSEEYEYHNMIVGGLLLLLIIKIYFDGSYKHIIKYLIPQQKELSYVLLVLSIILVIFSHNETLQKALAHAMFIILAHLFVESHSLSNLLLFSLISMYHFNSLEVE
tara:strand:+ start:3464 stop:3853 length:390 start_codon:yes stop_codon:yes gene_type:complete